MLSTSHGLTEYCINMTSQRSHFLFPQATLQMMRRVLALPHLTIMCMEVVIYLPLRRNGFSSLIKSVLLKPRCANTELSSESNSFVDLVVVDDTQGSEYILQVRALINPLQLRKSKESFGRVGSI